MNTAKKWLPLAFLATAAIGFAYIAVQQVYRQSANDPQIQMAKDIATTLASSTPYTIPAPSVDIAKSLAPYVIIYDDSGKPIAGNGFLEGKLPNLPEGVFSAARAVGQDVVTWQPRDGIRSAIVVVKISGGPNGFVVVGRSLREIEARENRLGTTAISAWVVTLVGTLIVIALLK